MTRKRRHARMQKPHYQTEAVIWHVKREDNYGNKRSGYYYGFNDGCVNVPSDLD